MFVKKYAYLLPLSLFLISSFTLRAGGSTIIYTSKDFCRDNDLLHVALSPEIGSPKPADLQKLNKLDPKAIIKATTPSYKTTHLHHSAMRGDLEVVAWLISQGACVNAEDRHKKTPLHEAAQFGRNKIVQLLIEKKAAVNTQTIQGFTPLHCAAASFDLDSVQILLNAGADTTIQNEYGNTPFETAKRSTPFAFTKNEENQKKIIGLLCPTDEYWTPLHKAAYYDCQIVAQRLIEKDKISVDIKNTYGSTPLHFASEKGNVKMVALLLAARANRELKNYTDRTPLEYIQSRTYYSYLERKNQEEIIALLQAPAVIGKTTRIGNTRFTTV